MKSKQYTNMMDELPIPEFHNTIHNELFTSHKKRIKYQPFLYLALTTCIIIACIVLPQKDANVMPFLIKVQANGETTLIHEDESATVKLKNTYIDLGNQQDNKFNILFETTTDNQTSQRIDLTLPINIEGNDIEQITYECSSDFTLLQPLYGLDNIIKGNDKEKEQAILAHLFSDETKNDLPTRTHYKLYSEMTAKGKKVYCTYIDRFKETLLKNTSFSEKDFFIDENIPLVIMMLHEQIYENETIDKTYAKEFRYNEYRYFTWGQLPTASRYQIAYEEQKNTSLQLQVQVNNLVGEDIYLVDKLFEKVSNAQVTIDIEFKNRTHITKNIRIGNLNYETGTYEMIIE